MHSLSMNLSPTSGTLKLLSGAAGVSMKLLMLFVSISLCSCLVLCVVDDAFSNEKRFFLFSFLLNEQTLQPDHKVTADAQAVAQC